MLYEVITVAGGLLLAFSGTFWRTALSIEVYALHILMLSLVLWSAVRLFFLPAEGTTLRNRMLLTALLTGLSFANHMSTIFLLPALLALLFMTHRRSAGFAKNLGLAAGAFAAGLLPYLYLPLRAASHPVITSYSIHYTKLYDHSLQRTSMNFTKRTHTCGQLRKEHVGQTVTLNGWVDGRRDLGGMIFIDLRDRYGLSQVVFAPQHNAGVHEKAHDLRSEYVLSITGTVRNNFV